MKINFTYSPQFNFSLTKKEAVFPVTKLDHLKVFWETNGDKIEKTLLDITGLLFTEHLKCYLNTEFSVSDPFCIKIEDLDEMKDNLIHELIHILLTQNKVGATSKWKEIMEKYKDEHPITRTHIVVHSIHSKLAQKLFPDRVEPIMNYSKKPVYVKAWEIVAKEDINSYFA